MSTPDTIATDAGDLARRVIREFEGDYGMTVGLKEDAETLLEKIREAEIAAVYDTVGRAAAVAALAAQNAPDADLLAGLKWAIRMMQGESGAGESYWDQFPEYVAACKALKRAEDV